MAPLSLALYKLSARRGLADGARALRPKGNLIWLMVDQPARNAAARLLVQHLVSEVGVSCLVTGMDPAGLPKGALLDLAPADHPQDAAPFLDHWNPQVIIMMGGQLPPLLIDQAAARAIPMLLADAEMPHLPRGGEWMFAGLLRHCAKAFHAILAVDENAARAYRRLGAGNVMRTGRMEAGAAAALPYNEPERAALATTFATRPIWLAIDVPIEEEAAVIAAHRAALRLAHRLLLILVPQDPNRAPDLARDIENSEGWVVARRDLDQDPDQETSVYIADTGQEYGLWYRLAPVTFLGGSLLGPGSARSPLEPAALGSAIIHGRKVGAYGQAFGRLGAALGAAPISTAGELAEFVTELLAPDRVARMAHAAWGVASEGAEVSDRIVKTALHLAAKGGQ